MDKYQRKLRVLIATGSTVGFLGGWALLAHAGKPVASSTLSTIENAAPPPPVSTPVTLPPLDFKTLEANGGSGSAQSIAPQSFVPAPSFQSFGRSRFRTGGS